MLGRGKRYVVAVAGLLVLLGGVAAPAFAAAGSFDDPDDVAGPIDVKKLTHADAGDAETGTITYTMETYDDWIPSQLSNAVWSLFHKTGAANQPALGYVQVQVDSSGAFKSRVQDQNGSDVQNSGITASKSGRILTVTFNRSALVNLGSETAYDYRFNAASSGTDYVPNFADDGSRPYITHQIGSGGTQATTSTTVAGATTTSSSSSTSTTTSTTVASGGSTCPAATLSANPTTMVAGGGTTLTGACFAPNTDITISMASTPVSLTSVRSNSSGGFVVSVTIPRGTAAGQHTISATGGGRAASTFITVGFAVTGGDHRGLAAMAAALVFAGLVLLAGRALGDQQEEFVRQR